MEPLNTANLSRIRFRNFLVSISRLRAVMFARPSDSGARSTGLQKRIGTSGEVR